MRFYVGGGGRAGDDGTSTPSASMYDTPLHHEPSQLENMTILGLFVTVNTIDQP